MNNMRRVMNRVFGAALVLLLVVGCAAPTAPATPVAGETPAEVQAGTEDATAPAEEEGTDVSVESPMECSDGAVEPPEEGSNWAVEPPAEGMCVSVPNELLVLGYQEVVDEVLVELVGEKNITKYPVEGDWSKPPGSEPGSEVDPEQPILGFDTLYYVSVDENELDQSVEDIVSKLQQNDPPISASLNHFAASFGHSGGESPFGKQPCPMPAPVPMPNPDSTVLRDQDVLANILMVGSEALRPSEEIAETREVNVGVFDTSPLPFLTYVESDIVAAAGSAGTPSPDEVSRDHGIFVSSLVQAVAPKAQVELYQALADHGMGSTLQILLAVMNFLQRHQPSMENPPVLNFSLGIYCHEPLSEDDRFPLGYFAALDLLLRVAAQEGAVIVAASGNNANRYVPETSTVPPAYPASADFAIGVGASSQGSDPPSPLTCYTQDAYVYAPGGDGISSSEVITGYPEIPPGGPEYCMPANHTCTDLGCDFGLVGLSTDSPTGYAFWSGTSFAAPLISGLAALYLEQQGDPIQAKQWVLKCADNAGTGNIVESIGFCPEVPVR